ncbi:thioesterase [Rhabdobacter roseus]|uniref:Medium-chain acyl-[acyl-carrier-protein] hydrolase n=1 Tax=Rhabdobacter roseus TaxID=1655419 RepID=A0A840TWY0_9BACT|nr:acyl-ACP thioesterase domain-containing protein [Rhabdobacter roseus]MBB5285773.1 medium-chain acyl-[acyl-carrier-protein] hydrolase [Rhabdobacter roseus]
MIYSETYRIRNYETDPEGRLWLSALANLLQDAADCHANQLGVGRPELLAWDLAWVLHRLVLSVNRWPRLGESITLETNPSGEERVYIYRDFRGYDSAGKLLFTATSTWLVLNLSTRRLTTPAPEIKRLFEPYRHLEHLPRPSGKFPAAPGTWTYQTTLQPRHNEIDANLHVNNGVYFQWLLESLPFDFLATHHCHHVDLVFKAEGQRGETVQVLSGPVGPNRFVHRVLNPQQAELVVALSTWSGPEAS